MIKVKSQRITALRKRFPNEWLLIAVDRVDPAKMIPLTGRIIEHSPSRETVYQKSIKHKGLDTIIYTGKPPKDVAFIF